MKFKLNASHLQVTTKAKLIHLILAFQTAIQRNTVKRLNKHDSTISSVFPEI